MDAVNLNGGFLRATPVSKKLRHTLKQTIKEFIRKNYKLPIVRRNLDK